MQVDTQDLCPCQGRPKEPGGALLQEGDPVLSCPPGSSLWSIWLCPGLEGFPPRTGGAGCRRPPILCSPRPGDCLLL